MRWIYDCFAATDRGATDGRKERNEGSAARNLGSREGQLRVSPKV